MSSGVQRLSRQDVRSVGVYQKVILLCILAYLAAVVVSIVLPPELRILVSLGMIGVSIASTVFVFLLAMKVYSTGMGVLLGILTLIPCIGLIVLLIVNGKATSVLRAHGYKVGLLGANLSAEPEPPRRPRQPGDARGTGKRTAEEEHED
jgi:hypothetical protein